VSAIPQVYRDRRRTGKPARRRGGRTGTGGWRRAPLGGLSAAGRRAEDDPMLTPTVTYIGAPHTVRPHLAVTSTPSVPARRLSSAAV